MIALAVVVISVLKVPNPAHPYGVRGGGEIGLASPIPAIAHVIKRRFRELPLKPRRVVKG